MLHQHITRKPDPAIGDTFGRLTIIGPVIRRPSASTGKAVKWLTVRCECGAEKDISLGNLRAARSCGCGQREAAARIGRETSTTHGEARNGKLTRIYKLWQCMRSRCKDPRPAIARRYRDRGIRVCDEWERSYPAFRDWAKANGYAPGLTLDRIDGDKGYGPDNCRWATMKQQQNNRCNNVRLTAFGEEKLLTEWPDDPRCPVGYRTLRARHYLGWDDEKAIATPKMRARKTNNE